MNKYFDTGQITIGENKDTELISSYGNTDIYNIEQINKAVGHQVEKLTIINDGPDHISETSKIGYRWNRTEFPNNIIIMSKFGYRWNRVVLHSGEARLIRNASELKIEANKGTKYKVTEFILVVRGVYLEQDRENMNIET